MEKKNKYITVLDFEVSRIFQYKLPKDIEYNNSAKFLANGGPCYEDFIIDKGHRLNNVEWMVHDIKEFVDHTIKSTIKKNK